MKTPVMYHYFKLCCVGGLALFVVQIIWLRSLPSLGWKRRNNCSAFVKGTDLLLHSVSLKRLYMIGKSLFIFRELSCARHSFWTLWNRKSAETSPQCCRCCSCKRLNYIWIKLSTRRIAQCCMKIFQQLPYVISSFNRWPYLWFIQSMTSIPCLPGNLIFVLMKKASCLHALWLLSEGM